MPDDFSPSLDNLARRQTGTQQWQTAIEQQRQRDLVRPSMGEQLGDVVNRIIAGNPIMQMAQLYRDLSEGRVDVTSPEAAGRGLWSAMGMAGAGMPYAEQGALGAGGGKPPFYGRQIGKPPTPANTNQSWRQMMPGKAARFDALSKLVANKDFKPVMTRDGRMWWRSLSREENEALNQIGWSRAPNVRYEDEIGGFDFGASEAESNQRSQWAWEQNIRHWLGLSTPSGWKS